jgi:hypothetical protein
MHHGKSNCWAATLCLNHTIGRLGRWKSLWQHRYYVLKMKVNRASTIFGLATSKMQGLCGDIKPLSHYQLPFKAKIVASRSPLCHTNECQQLLALHPGKCKGCTATLCHKRIIGPVSVYRFFWRHCHDTLKMSVNGASTIIGLTSWKIKGLCACIDS